jgi:hypothetical protein
MIKVIIAGGRTFDNYFLLEQECNKIFASIDPINFDIEIVSGTANGADKLGESFAKNYNLKVARFPANWDLYGKSAGYKRNEQMAKYAMQDSELGVLIAFWDGESRGTKHMIDLANKHGLKVFVVRYK